MYVLSESQLPLTNPGEKLTGLDFNQI